MDMYVRTAADPQLDRLGALIPVEEADTDASPYKLILPTKLTTCKRHPAKHGDPGTRITDNWSLACPSYRRSAGIYASFGGWITL